jgi:transcriptional regulator with XRE-family HTH domain
MARAALNWTVRDLAKATGLHRNTITNIEVGRYVGDPGTLASIQKVLASAGIEFIDENGGGPGVRMHQREPKPIVSINPKKSMPKVLVSQIKAARSLLAWSQEQLAYAAGLSVPTIKRLEANGGPLGGRSDTVDKIRGALQKAGVDFIDENGGGPGVRLRQWQSKR